MGSATIEEETYGVGEKMTFEGGRPKPLIVVSVVLVGKHEGFKKCFVNSAR
jgi:hypothetical protein